MFKMFIINLLTHTKKKQTVSLLSVQDLYKLSYKQSVDFKWKIGFYFPEITLTTEFPGMNFLLATFSIGCR